MSKVDYKNNVDVNMNSYIITWNNYLMKYYWIKYYTPCATDTWQESFPPSNSPAHIMLSVIDPS